MVHISIFATSAALLSTVTLVTSIPIVEIPGTSRNLQSRELLMHTPGLKADDTKNKAEVCGHQFKGLTAQQKKDIWWQTRAVASFDAYLGGKGGSGSQDWVRNLDKRVTGKSQSGWDCATLGGTSCSSEGLSCDPYFDAGIPWAFYAMWSATKAHGVLNYFKDGITKQTIINFLKKDELTKDFGHNPNGINPFGIVSGAFGAASGAAGVAGQGPASGMLGIVSGSFGIASSIYKPKDPNAQIMAMLGDFLEKSLDTLENTALNLFGDGDQTQLPRSALGPDEIITLEDKGPRGQYNQIAAFLGDGVFLIECIECAYNEVVEKGNILLQQALGIRVLDSLSNFLWIDLDVKDQGSCGGSLSHYWMNDMCFSIRTQPSAQNTDPINMKWAMDTISDDVSGKLVGKYQAQLAELYDNAYVCRRERKDGNFEVDAGNIPYDGSLPQCFFSIDVKKGTWDDNTGNFNLIDL